MLSHSIQTRASSDAGSAGDPALAGILGSGNASASGAVVTTKTALGVSAVFACVRNTAESIAGLPCVLRETVHDGDQVRTEDAVAHPLYSVLIGRPNEWQTSFDYWAGVIEHIQLRGNHYSRVIRNGAGFTIGLEPLHPDRVRPYWTSRRLPAYEYYSESGEREIFLTGEIFHVRGPLQDDGLSGMSPIQIHRETIGMAQASRDYGARLFANDAQPRGVLELDGALDDQAFQRLKEDWKNQFGGKNLHSVAILEGGAKFNAIGLSNEDAQYLETRKFTDAEIARLFRVPAHKIVIDTQLTLNNIEHQNREWVTDTLNPLARRIEDAISRDLITEDGRLTLKPRFDFGELLRGDVKTQTEANSKGIQWGWLSPNDVRERFGLNPIGPEGDVYVSPVNMQPMAALLGMAGSGADDGSGGSA